MPVGCVYTTNGIQWYFMGMVDDNRNLMLENRMIYEGTLSSGKWHFGWKFGMSWLCEVLCSSFKFQAMEFLLVLEVISFGGFRYVKLEEVWTIYWNSEGSWSSPLALSIWLELGSLKWRSSFGWSGNTSMQSSVSTNWIQYSIDSLAA